MFASILRSCGLISFKVYLEKIAEMQEMLHLVKLEVLEQRQRFHREEERSHAREIIIYGTEKRIAELEARIEEMRLQRAGVDSVVHELTDRLRAADEALASYKPIILQNVEVRPVAIDGKVGQYELWLMFGRNGKTDAVKVRQLVASKYNREQLERVKADIEETHIRLRVQ